MDREKLTPWERDLRATIRGFMLTATPAELRRELEMTKTQASKDAFRVQVLQELVDEEEKS